MHASLMGSARMGSARMGSGSRRRQDAAARLSFVFYLRRLDCLSFVWTI